MSGQQGFPPPGQQPGQQPGQPPHPGPPPGWYPVPPAPYPVPALLGAAHKPGAIPLRPLGLGDIYDAAFKIIRFNPRATVGSAVLVTAVAMAIPVALTAFLTFVLDLSLDPAGTDYTGTELAGLVGSFGSLLLGLVLQSLGLVLVTGMMAHVVHAASVGRRLSLGEAWAATYGRRWRLIGLTLTLGSLTTLLLVLYALAWIPVVSTQEVWAIVVWGLVTVPLFLAGLVWFWVRVYYLPVPALMLERIGVFAAIGRGYSLTRTAFWRTLGIALLTVVLAQIAGSMLSFPVSLLGQVGAAAGATTRYALLIVMVTQALTSVIAAAFVAPFTTAVATLQYVDQRMRKEAYDVALMSEAGITGS